MDNNGEMVISIEEACGSSPTVIEKGVNILWRLIIASVTFNKETFIFKADCLVIII